MNNISIKVSNKSKFLCNALYIYNSLYINRLKLSNEYKDKIKEVDSLRQKAFKESSEAIEHNSEILFKIIESLKHQISIDDLLKYGFHESAMKSEKTDLKSYMVDFRFLKRDWCGTLKGEEEIEGIVSCLKTVAKNYVDQNEKALFLGCGLGRIGWELTPYFKKISMIDKSYSMAFLFNHLLTENLKIFEIPSRNLTSLNQSAVAYNASINYSSVNSTDAIEKIDYVVGDVLSLPFEDNSFACVSSIYFTDVVAIRLYIDEIIRVLKTSGIFIHFGPLAYFFSEIKEHLSCEEITQEFESLGFVTLENRFVETEFLPLSSAMSSSIQRNWLFVAKLGEPKEFSDIKDESFCLNEPVKYIKKGAVNCSEEVVEITNRYGKTFTNAAFVVKILNVFGKGKKPNSVISRLEKKYHLTSTEIKDVEKVILKLIKQKFLVKNEAI